MRWIVVKVRGRFVRKLYLQVLTMFLDQTLLHLFVSAEFYFLSDLLELFLLFRAPSSTLFKTSDVLWKWLTTSLCSN